MLSKVAERVYWIARYLERVESTARLIRIYDQLLFDLPRNIKLSWYNLIVINNLEEAYHSHYSVEDERNVIKFMIGDTDNTSSIHSSLNAIRENVRTTRDVVLEETWEQTNELSLFVTDHLQEGINRGSRHEFLENIIKGCQQIQGLLRGNMPHDAAWYFLRLGRNLERADMTTRNLDAGIAAILELEDDENAVNSQQIIWGTVLRSLNVQQSYQRSTRSSVDGAEVVKYLLQNAEQPRAITHCIGALTESALKLPQSDSVLECLKQISLTDADYSELGTPMREYLNTLQIELADLHRRISTTWFPTLN